MNRLPNKYIKSVGWNGLKLQKGIVVIVKQQQQMIMYKLLDGNGKYKGTLQG